MSPPLTTEGGRLVVVVLVRSGRMSRKKEPRVGKVRTKKRTRSGAGGRKGGSHTAKPDDLRDKGPSGEVVVRKMTDEDRARFEERKRSR